MTATQDGCEGLPAEVSITFENCEIIIPTAFTPDDDQVNDTWNLGDIDAIYPNNVVSVYNRLGNKKESDQGAYSQRPWNGTFNEKNCPSSLLSLNLTTLHKIKLEYQYNKISS